MKKTFFILLSAFFLVFFFSILINPVIIFLVKRQLSTIFHDSKVSIGACRLDFTRQLSFYDVALKNQDYDILIKEAKTQYSLSSIFAREIPKFSLKETKIYINLPQKNIAEFSQYLNFGNKSAFLVKSLELSNFCLDLKAKDLTAKGVLSIVVNPVEQIMDQLEIKIDSLGIQGFNLSGLTLEASQGLSGGHFGISRIEYDKLKIFKVKSQVI